MKHYLKFIGVAAFGVLAAQIGRQTIALPALAAPTALRDATTVPRFDPKSLASYAFDPSIPAAERIAVMPEPLLRLWRSGDEAPSYTPYEPNPQERRAFAAAVGGLPPKIKKVLEDRLIAVYFISNLKGNGITDWVLDSSSRVYVYTVLNPAAFRKSLSETLTDRDLSVFQGTTSVEVDVGSGGSGILYSVSHEFAHAFDYVIGLTSYTDPDMAAALGRQTNVSWDVWASYTRPKPENDYPMRSRLHFYGFRPPALEASQAGAAYAQLSNSPFISLYGSTNWADDAAELFVFRHLTADLGRPYRIYVRRPDGTDTAVEPLSNPRVRERASRVLAPMY